MSNSIRSGRGAKVTLRPATPLDLARVFEWFSASDLTREVMGAPLFPDRPVLDIDAFRKIFPIHIFDGSRVFDGRGWIIRAASEEVGFLAHGRVDLARDVAELDVWLAARRFCGQGLGSAALEIACRRLQDDFGVNRFVLRPSRRNVHALRAMRRAGFRDVGIDPKQVAAKLELRAGDYLDEVLLFRVLPLPPAQLRPEPGQRYVFIDSEFTSLERPTLISFGAIDGAGATFYRELAGWSAQLCSDFVRREVLPLLDGGAVAAPLAAADFIAWLRGSGPFDDAVTLVSDSGFDRWAVAELIGSGDLPRGVRWQRVPIPYQELDQVAAQLGLRRHHALDDAVALRQAVLNPEQ